MSATPSEEGDVHSVRTLACDCGAQTPRDGAEARGWRKVAGRVWMCPPCVAEFRAWLAAATLVTEEGSP